jgi:hypothetical protein
MDMDMVVAIYYFYLQVMRWRHQLSLKISYQKKQ